LRLNGCDLVVLGADGLDPRSWDKGWCIVHGMPWVRVITRNNAR
jgi:hypothetical protein